MPGTDEQLKWEEQLNRSPKWVQATIILTRLTVTQLFILFVIGLCIFLFAKDMGYIADKNQAQLQAIVKHLEANASAISQQLDVTKRHSENTEQLVESVKQTTRYLCWTSKIPDEQKGTACSR